MKHSMIVVVTSATAALWAACTPPAPEADTAFAADEHITYLLVQTAPSVRYGNGALVLESVHDHTLYFSDRPNRVTGWLPTAEQIEDWGVGDDSFADDPPNADLSVLVDGEQRQVVVVLTNPRFHGNGDDLVYDVEILEGEMPATGGPSTLFIDVIGLPLTPTSTGGASQATQRRVSRRR